MPKCGCGRVIVDDMEIATGDCWECGSYIFDAASDDDDEYEDGIDDEPIQPSATA